MRALSSLLLTGAVGLGGLLLAPGTASAEGYGGWRGRDHYRYYAPPPPRHFYRPPAFYAPPPAFYGPPPVYYRPPPPVYYRPPPPAFYAPPPAFYGPPPVAYGIRPGPGVGLFIR